MDDGGRELPSSQCRGIGRYLEVIWAIPSNFTFRLWHQFPSRLVRVFLGTLWSFVKQIKALYLFDWEQEIALHAMQGNRALSCGEGEVSWVFSSCGMNMGYIL